MKLTKFYSKTFLALASLGLLFSSCDEEETPVAEPVAEFTFSPANPVAGEEITFTNASENAATYTWSFGDGETSTDENPTHSFGNEGDFTVTLTATGEGGNKVSEKQITIVYPRLMVVDADSLVVQSYNFSNSSFSIVSSLVERSLTIAADASSDALFFVDDYNGLIYKSKLDGSGVTEIASGFNFPVGLSVNTTTKKLFVVDRGDVTIVALNYDGTGSSVLFDATDGLEVPVAISVDAVNNHIYINDVGAAASNYAADGIWKGNVDGSSISKVITGGGYSVAVAPELGKLFYNDAFVTNNLMVADLDDLSNGSEFATLAYERCYGLVYFGGRVYWTDLGADLFDGRIYKANVAGGSVTTLAEGVRDPRGLVVIK